MEVPAFHMVSTDTVVKDSSLQVDNDEGPDGWARAPLIPAQWRREEGTPCDCQVEAQAPHIVSLTRGDGGLMISCQGWKFRLSLWPSLTLPSPLLELGGLITTLQMWRSDSPLGLCWHCRATAFPVVFAWSTKIIISLSWTLSWSFGEREQASVWTFAGQCLSKFLGCRSSPLRIPRPQASLPSSLLMFIF